MLYCFPVIRQNLKSLCIYRLYMTRIYDIIDVSVSEISLAPVWSHIEM